MAEQISTAHGADAVRIRLNAIDPNRVAYDKFFGKTAPLLIKGHNEIFAEDGIADDVEEIKRDLARRPF